MPSQEVAYIGGIARRSCHDRALRKAFEVTKIARGLLHLFGPRREIEVVAPGGDLAALHFEDSGHRQLDALAAHLEDIDPLVHHDVAGCEALQNLELD